MTQTYTSQNKVDMIEYTLPVVTWPIETSDNVLHLYADCSDEWGRKLHACVLQHTIIISATGYTHFVLFSIECQ